MRTLHKSNRKRCRGGAAVEVALTAPLVFALVFGLMEWSRFENIRQVASTAAFNASRTGTIPGVTTTEMEANASNILDLYSISNATVDASISSTKSTVSVSIPIGDNSWFLKRFFGNARINREFSLSLQNVGT